MRKHFLGAIIVTGAVSADPNIVATREVIDGQQRTTTLQLLLLALRDVAKGFKENQYLHNQGRLNEFQFTVCHLTNRPRRRKHNLFVRFATSLHSLKQISERKSRRGTEP